MIDVQGYLRFLEIESRRLSAVSLYPPLWPGLLTRRSAVLDFGLNRFAKRDGIGVEFGVYRGHSLRRSARRLPDRKFHGFDSFEGFPDDGRRDWRLDFSTVGLPAVPRNCRLWPGWFDATLPAFLDEISDPIGFLHIDCDIYSSTRQVLFALRDRLKPGVVIVFDELLNYETYLWNELLALYEFLEETGYGMDWLAVHQHVRRPGETMDLIESRSFPSWRSDQSRGYRQQAAGILTSARATGASDVSTEELERRCRQFLRLSQQYSSLPIVDNNDEQYPAPGIATGNTVESPIVQ